MKTFHWGHSQEAGKFSAGGIRCRRYRIRSHSGRGHIRYLLKVPADCDRTVELSVEYFLTGQTFHGELQDNETLVVLQLGLITAGAGVVILVRDRLRYFNLAQGTFDSRNA